MDGDRLGYRIHTPGLTGRTTTTWPRPKDPLDTIGWCHQPSGRFSGEGLRRPTDLRRHGPGQRLHRLTTSRKRLIDERPPPELTTLRQVRPEYADGVAFPGLPVLPVLSSSTFPRLPDGNLIVSRVAERPARPIPTTGLPCSREALRWIDGLLRIDG